MVHYDSTSKNVLPVVVGVVRGGGNWAQIEIHIKNNENENVAQPADARQKHFVVTMTKVLVV